MDRIISPGDQKDTQLMYSIKTKWFQFIFRRRIDLSTDSGKGIAHMKRNLGYAFLIWVHCSSFFTKNTSVFCSHNWPRGPMDKASAYGAGDCRFESCRGHFHNRFIWSRLVQICAQHSKYSYHIWAATTATWANSRITLPNTHRCQHHTYTNAGRNRGIQPLCKLAGFAQFIIS